MGFGGAWGLALGNVTVGEVNTSPPEGGDPSELQDYIDEWESYARSAGINDDAEIKNVGCFMKQTTGTTAAKGFGANALTDALQAAGVTVNSVLETALIQFQTGETIA